MLVPGWSIFCATALEEPRIQRSPGSPIKPLTTLRAYYQDRLSGFEGFEGPYLDDQLS